MPDQNTADQHTAPVEPTTRILSRFLARTFYDDIPEDVRTRTKYLMLDGFGCGLLAAQLDWSRRAVETLQTLDGTGPGVVWGWTVKLPPMSAALLNGTFVQGFEVDDYHPFGPLHSESCTMPAVLATAEQLGGITGKPITGRQILESTVLGFEVGPRIGMAMGGLQLVTRGWHCGSVYGVIGAVAGAGKIRGLNEEQFESAIGNGATQACGLMSAQFEAMVKRMHSGIAARSGVLAAALAGAGFTGITEVLERDWAGFFSTFCGVDPYDASQVTDKLGEWWETTRIAVKPEYSCMAGTHTSVENAIKLRNTPGFNIDDVAHIRIGLVEAMKHHGGFTLERPAASIGAQMSHCYVVAVTLLDGPPSVQQFAPERINRDDIWNLLPRIEAARDPEIESRGKEGRWGTKLTVTYKNGKSEVIETKFPRGGPKFPLTNDDIVRKYDRLTSMVMNKGDADRLKDCVLNLENCKDSAELSRLLSVQTHAPF